MSFMSRLLHWVASKLPPPRVIMDRAGVSKYLSRWYLFGAPRMPDGSHPFDEYGVARDGIIWGSRRFGVYLHKFHRGDDDLELHSHPWRWSFSIILYGGYVEERRVGDRVVTRVVRPGSINWIGGDDFHRVDLLKREAWTLFVAGPKASTWGFWNRDTGVVLQWRDFIARKRGTA